jgi:pre-mRNA-splicing factor CWC26
MGDVQRRGRAERRAALEEAKYMPLGRGVDDEEMNAELRAKARWNDPAREFLKSSTTAAATGAGASGKGQKVYTGPAPPNRYGIKPGHRWDGVDRGNGFEQEWFAARNNRERKVGLEYAWLRDE